MSTSVVQHARTLIEQNLPLKVTWQITGMSICVDFSRCRDLLKPLQKTDTNSKIEDEWKALYLFGEEDYADGGGAHPWLGVNEDTGKIYGLDIQRTEPIYFLNTDVEKYIKTFLLFDNVVRQGQSSIEELSKSSRKLDPAFTKSDWRLLADYLQKDV